MKVLDALKAVIPSLFPLVIPSAARDLHLRRLADVQIPRFTRND
jgi:hypothetical protein